jgi:hypothetical protein
MESDEKELAKYAKKRKLSTDPDCDSTDHLYDIVNDKEWISCSSSCGSGKNAVVIYINQARVTNLYCQT